MNNHCNRCGKWNGAHATLPGQSRDHLCMCQPPARAALAAQPGAVGEPCRPDILERLTYHARERRDLTLDDCLSYLAKGWRNVPGRTEREMVLQILALLAAAPTEAKPAQQDAVDAERYRELRRGMYWSVVDAIGDHLRDEALDGDIDAAISAKKGG